MGYGEHKRPDGPRPGAWADMVSIDRRQHDTLPEVTRAVGPILDEWSKFQMHYIAWPNAPMMNRWHGAIAALDAAITRARGAGAIPSEATPAAAGVSALSANPDRAGGIVIQNESD